jgi:DHA2 family multidrug resistance protein
MRGVTPGGAESAAMQTIYGQTVRQATAMGFNDAFLVLSVLMICIFPLILLIRRPHHQGGPPPAPH